MFEPEKKERGMRVSEELAAYGAKRVGKKRK